MDFVVKMYVTLVIYSHARVFLQFRSVDIELTRPHYLRKSTVKSWNFWCFLDIGNISLSLHVRYAKAILF